MLGISDIALFLMPRNFVHQYNVLYIKATADIQLAKMAISAGDKDIDDATMVFHLQQAAEKDMSGRLSLRGRLPNETNNTSTFTHYAEGPRFCRGIKN